MPKCEGKIATMRNSGMLAHAERPHTRTFGIVFVAREGRFVLLPGANKVATVVKCHPHQKQSFHPHAGVIEFFGVINSFIGKFQGEIHFAAHNAPSEVPPHCSKALLRSADSLAKLPSTVKSWADLRRCVTPNGDIGGAQGCKNL